MAKRARGEVVVREWKAGRGYALRFSAYGRRRYLTLGLEAEGWTPERAQEELENVLADVRRGLWVPPRRGAAKVGEGRRRSHPVEVLPRATRLNPRRRVGRCSSASSRPGRLRSAAPTTATRTIATSAGA